ncbi:hypothetical protein NDU88_005509 [Pleurodeles waltl]|uniref:Uncharacterized protein n=1 Tax=Pleurodeles waltl TaxID=8319 RepID=A0AAV7L103_PLEWA|nr:hypothetical protein NDU88_005509 [Pleurodeles waltl]
MGIWGAGRGSPADFQATSHTGTVPQDTRPEAREAPRKLWEPPRCTSGVTGPQLFRHLCSTLEAAASDLQGSEYAE